MNLRKTNAFIGSTLALTLLLSACGFSMPGQQTEPPPTPAEALAPFDDDTVIVEGRLMPYQAINLAFSSSGLIQDMHIREGSDVVAGQVLASLEGVEQIEATIENANLAVISALQAIELLNDNYAGALADAQQKLAQAKIDLKKAQDDRASMEYRRASGATLDGLRADLILAQKALDKAQDYYDHNTGAGEEIVAQALRNLASAKLARDRAQYNLNYASDLPDTDEIDRANANVRLAEARLNISRENLDRLSSGPDPREIELAKARLQAAQANLQAAQAQRNNLDLKAPIDGKIVGLRISQGEQVIPGQVIAALADFSRWVVETSDLTELNVVKIKQGQKVTLIADAMPDQQLSGTVERISNSYLDKQGDVTYTVRITLDQKDQWLRWGMTFSVQFDPTTAVEGVTLPGTTVGSETNGMATTVPDSQEDAALDTRSAEIALKSYLDSFNEQDAKKAAGFLSNYSLVAERTTRAEVIKNLETQFETGTLWSNLVINENRVQDSSTILFRVNYQITDKDTQTGTTSVLERDEWWPVRLENGTWLVNWQNVIDYRGLDVPAQTVGGLTISPVQMIRYTDRMELVLIAQNRTNDPIVLGQPGESLALFSFGEKTIEASNDRWILEPMRSYPDIRIEVQGTFLEYPQKVEIRKWKDIQSPPWYTFVLSDEG